jgi:hypothetical protein
MIVNLAIRTKKVPSAGKIAKVFLVYNKGPMGKLSTELDFFQFYKNFQRSGYISSY